jgi:PhzF family phenazine biosynthesis protein
MLARLSAFTTAPEGGNPAGVWIGEELPPAAEMQRIAAEVGYSETAFLAPGRGRERTLRFYSPAAEIPFCGHATIAAGVLLGELEGNGTYRLATTVGEVPVVVTGEGAEREAALTSVEPSHEPPAEGLVDEVLASLRWRRDELEPGWPPAVVFAGSRHLLLAARSAERLARLDYDFERLRAAMAGERLITIQLVWRERPDLFHARDPFPIGGVVEDPATGSAAAALGGWLRASGRIVPPASFTILQGEAMGRPSRITVDVPPRGGIVVRGTAVHIPG